VDTESGAAVVHRDQLTVMVSDTAQLKALTSTHRRLEPPDIADIPENTAAKGECRRTADAP
jgi:hypothetical protein